MRVGKRDHSLGRDERRTSNRGELGKLHERIVDGLLRFYPRSFRESFGRDLKELYRDAQLGFFEIVWDLCKNALIARWKVRQAHKAQNDRSLRPRRRGMSLAAESTVRDLRYGIRSLFKKPLFSVLALATLMLGIGANVAIFTVLYWIVLRPLPYRDPDTLVRVWWRPASFNQRIVAAFRERSETLESLSAFSGWAFTLTGDGDPEVINGVQVSTSHFDLLGTSAQIGRTFLPEDSEPGRSDVVVLSYGLWQRRFGGDPEILGRRLELAGAGRRRYTVVGVLPSSHAPIEPGGDWELWVPLERPADLARDESWFLSVVARLSAGKTVSEATAEVRELARQVKREWYPRTSEDEIRLARVAPLSGVIVGPTVRSQLWLLFAAVAVVLMVVCGNVASLLLARATDREHEMIIRSALGASRRRLVRQSLTESLLLGGLGGLAGIGVAVVAVTSVAKLLPDDLPRTAGLLVDAPALVFAVLVSVVTGLAVGLAPALRSSHPRAGGRLRSSTGQRGPEKNRVQRTLVTIEVALSVTLVAVAGLLIQSFWRLAHVDPGFDPEHVLVLGVYAPSVRYPDDPSLRNFYRELMPRLGSLHGVEAVGSIHMLPMGIGSWTYPVYPQGHVLGATDTPPSVNFRVVSPGYFRSMRIPLLAGRALTDRDRNDAPAVGLVNETMARRLWPGQDAVGKQVHVFDADGPAFTVVGVVGDIHQSALDVSPQPEMYRPLEQWTLARNFVTLRTSLPLEALAISAREVVRSMDRDVPVIQLGPMSGVVSSSLSSRRFLTSLLTAFAGLASFLAAVGVYGVTSYMVSSRRGEIGLRMALGAGRREVLREALVRGMRPALFGIVLGLIGAIAMSPLVQSLLFGVTASSPVTLLAVGGLLSLVALLACWIPARRATRIDPMTALRAD